MSAKKKIIYSPEGDKEVHTFANAFDLLNHAGYTSRPVTKAVEIEEETKSKIGVAETEESDMPDFEAFSKEALEDYASEHFGVSLDKRKGQATLANEVAELYRDHNEDEAE